MFYGRNRIFALFRVRVDFNKIALILVKVSVEFEFASAMRANASTKRNNSVALRAEFEWSLLRSFLLIGLKRPVVIFIGQSVPQIILNMVNDNGDFVRIVRVRAESSHGLLNKQSKRFGRSGKNDGLTIRDVKPFSKKFSIAKDFNFAIAKIFNDTCAESFCSIAVAMSGGNACVSERLSNGL